MGVVFLLLAIVAAGTANDSPELNDRRVCSATVRVVVHDQRGIVYGTGTLVEVVDAEGLIVTCGHTFEYSQPGTPVKVTLFAREREENLAGQLLSFDLKNDVGLVTVHGVRGITPIQLAPRNYKPCAGESVIVAGCDEGRPPTKETTKIVSVNRFLGAPNIEVTAMPPHGRSGGGLFTDRTELIGVCTGQNQEDGEGLYAGLASVYEELAKTQTKFHASQLKALDTAANARPLLAASPQSTRQEASHLLTHDSTTSLTLNERVQNPPLDVEHDSVATSNNQTGTEVICIVRSRSLGSASRIIVLDSASHEFLRALVKEQEAAKRPR